MSQYRPLRSWRRHLIVGTLGTTFALPLGACQFDEFTTTTTTTLDSRAVMQYLVNSWVVTPITSFIQSKVDQAFDNIFGTEE